MRTNEVEDQEARRGECYRLLAGGFYQPEKEILSAESFFNPLIRSLEAVCPSALPFARGMAEGAAICTEEELTVQYAKLFVGPFELAAPPYGSVYLDPGRAVMGPSTARAHEFYLACGLKLADGFEELPDHIAVELEFMAYLIHRQLAATAAGNPVEADRYGDLQATFLDDYLLPWVGAFCAAIREGNQGRFYTGLADCLEAVARFDGERLAARTVAVAG